MSTTPLRNDNDQALRDVAFKRVKDRRDFQGHLVAYLVVNLFLWALWALTSGPSSYPWPALVSLGWGIGVVLNWWSVTRRPIMPEDVAREMDRLSH
jgi:hypothetical protein